MMLLGVNSATPGPPFALTTFESLRAVTFIQLTMNCRGIRQG